MIISLLGGVVPTFVILAKNGIVPEGLDASFGVRYGALVTLYFMVLGAAAGFATAAVVRLALAAARHSASLAPVSRGLPRIAVGMLGGFFLAAAILGNGGALTSILFAPGPLRFRVLAPLATVTSLAALGAASVLPLSARRLLRGLLCLVLGAAAIALMPRSAAPIAPRLELATDAAPLCLIGLDGADWKLIEKLFARGELPHLRELRSRAAWGPLRTVKPTHSPLLWSTMATGRGPEDHRISTYRMLRFPGLHRDFADLYRPRGYALSSLYRLLRKSGVMFQTTITSADRRVPAYWNLVSRAGGRVAVLNWWASWPAEAVNGFVVSERIHFARLIARGMPTATERLTYPPELYADIAPLLVGPEDVTLENARAFMDVTAADFEEMKTASYRHHVLKSEFKYMFSMFETDRRLALLLLRRARENGSATDFLLYFRLPDLASHAALKYSDLVGDHLDATPEELAKFARVVTEAYRRVDDVVGDIVSSFGAGNVVIVSDHGFELETPKGKSPRYAHDEAPAGIFLGLGPAFRPGRVEGLSIYEVFPLLAYLKGMPIAEELDGRVPVEALEPALVERHPIRRISSYGTKEALDAEIASSPADKTMIDRLRALGYVE